MAIELRKDAENIELFRATASSDEDRIAFVETWGAMISEVLPVESYVRSIYTPEYLQPGVTPVYTSDIQPINAWYLPKFGQHPVNIVETEEVSVNTFQVVGDVTYKMRDAEQARILFAERALQRLKDSMISFEETAGWAVLKAAVVSDKTLDAISNETGLTKKVASEAFRLMEADRGYKVTDIYVNPRAMADIRMWASTTIDPVTQREIWTAGGLNGIWGANIHFVYEIPETEAYFLDTTPNKLGYMPIRTDVTTYDDPTAVKNFNVGVIARAEYSFVVMDANCIVKATLAYS